MKKDTYLIIKKAAKQTRGGGVYAYFEYDRQLSNRRN